MGITKAVDTTSLLLSAIKFLGILLLISLLIELTAVDSALADLIYQWEGNKWHLKNNWITAILIHKGGKYLSITMLLLVLTLLTISHFFTVLAGWKSRFLYLLTSTLLGTITVSLVKAISHISCPWDFTRYGGTLDYLSLMEQLWVRNGSQCFPAGHASAGFAWVSLYFVGLHASASWRFCALIFALLLGCIFGISQQLRGAHFLSHDVWSFGICWVVSFICYEVMLKPYELTR